MCWASTVSKALFSMLGDEKTCGARAGCPRGWGCPPMHRLCPWFTCVCGFFFFHCSYFHPLHVSTHYTFQGKKTLEMLIVVIYSLTVYAIEWLCTYSVYLWLCSYLFFFSSHILVLGLSSPIFSIGVMIIRLILQRDENLSLYPKVLLSVSVFHLAPLTSRSVTLKDTGLKYWCSLESLGFC